MTSNIHRALALLAACLVVVTVSATEKGKPSMVTAAGTFEVKLKPEPPSEKGGAATLGRMSIDKTFHGDLEGTSAGEMLMVRTAVEGSAGYVAIEQVTAKLAGRGGTFLLQHNGIMDKGKPQLSVSVVPDSGTGELAGLNGSMEIEIKDGKHFYRFTYALPEACH